jgi:RNA polymerase sigma factor (sigma-70 family)
MSPSVTVRLLATQSDGRLVELARQGHERAFEALVQRYRRPLLSYCRRVLLPETRAEDALQQALLQAWLALQHGVEVRDVRAWLYRIVRNTALNALRSSGYDYAELTEALSGVDAPQEDLDRRIAVREALAGLAALPEQQREALMRTAVAGASHAAAAAEMGVSETALRGLVYRARASLRTAVTAITPMPLVSWAAAAAGHGGGAVAELVAGGGSAGLAGLLAKGGALALTAGVVAVGVGTVEHAHHAARPARAAVRADDTAPHGVALASAPLVVHSLGGEPSAGDRPGGGHDRRHRGGTGAPAMPGASAPEVRVGPSRGGGEGDGRGVPPRNGASTGDGGRGDGGGGPGPGGRQGGDRLPGSGTTAPGGDGGSGDGSGSGDGARTGSGDGGSTSGDGGGSASGGDGGSTSGGDGGTSTGEGGSTSDGGGSTRGSSDGGSGATSGSGDLGTGG